MPKCAECRWHFVSHHKLEQAGWGNCYALPYPECTEIFTRSGAECSFPLLFKELPQMIEYKNQPRDGWPSGPWDDEPDKVEYVDEATGLPALIVRNGVGALCGYVGVPPGHPAHGQHYDRVDANVHGGLTFAGGCHQATEKEWERAKNQNEIDKKTAEQYPRGDAARRLYDPALQRAMLSYTAYVQLIESRAVCHKSGLDNVWWLGFDCAHWGDATPGIEALLGGRRDEGTYRTIEYVKGEIRNLALQLKGVAIHDEAARTAGG